MPNDAPEELVIRNIEPGDNISGFILSGKINRPLKSFLRKEAHPYEENSLARTWVASFGSGPDVAGFITIVSGEVSVAKTGDVNHQGGLRFRYPFYPAVKIARLAIDDRYAGRKLGRTLVDFSLGIAKAQICPLVGCRFAIVDAKKDSIGFYEKCGFTLLDTDDNMKLDHPFMFLDLIH
jgi:GNAT superfamily N-acetyltransferase